MVNGLREVSVSLDGCWAPQPACPQAKKITYNNRDVSNKLYMVRNITCSREFQGNCPGNLNGSHKKCNITIM